MTDTDKAVSQPHKRKLWMLISLLGLAALSTWFAWDLGLFDPDDRKLVQAALAEPGGDLEQVEAVIAVFDEQTALKRTGWRRRHGPWRTGMSAYVDALGTVMNRAPAAPAGERAAVWIVDSHRGPVAQEALRVLQKYHLASVDPASLLYQPYPEADDLLRHHIESQSDELTRARAQLILVDRHLALAEAGSEADTILALDADEQEGAAFFFGGLTFVEFASTHDPEAEQAAATALLKELRPKVTDLFPEDEASDIHSMMNRQLDLGIGTVAPEIIGTDLDGNEMRLSDFRDKVVVLDFWGDW